MFVCEESMVREGPLAAPKSNQKVWIDVLGDGSPPIPEVLAALGWDSHLGQTLVRPIERSQMQYVDGLLFLSVFVSADEALQSLHLVLGPHVIVTVHQQPLQILRDIAEELPQKVELLDSAHYLLYEILERISDGFLEQMDAYEEQFDNLEEDILDGHDRARDVFALRRELHHRRGILADMRRVAARLARRSFSGNSAGVSDSSIFVDVYDGFYHVMDNIDSLRDNLTGLVDLQLNQRSMRLNEIMKFLTIFSTIFLPLTFITGFFGMNLHSMPELAVPFGQEYTIALMLLIVVGMLYVFKRKHWLWTGISTRFVPCRSAWRLQCLRG